MSIFKNARSLNEQQKSMLANLLDQIFERLDLTETQRERIETAYNAVGEYLASCDDLLLKDAKIYSQGSMRIKTAVKPLNKDEFDVDLILFLPNAKYATRDEILAVIKKHLLDHKIYRDLVEDLARGFRINYKGDYHLDITPAKEYTENLLEGHPLWVVDKRNQFKESNPDGMALKFDKCCLLKPKVQVRKMVLEALNSESVEDLPDQSIKHLLNRIVQILKRHRDIWAQGKNNPHGEFKPISVLLTTLASKAYTEAVDSGKIYVNEFDLILDVIELMPHHIESQFGEVLVANPSMREENYAEKWNRLEKNEGFKLQQAFFEWHKAAVDSFEHMFNSKSNGLDTMFESLSSSFGEGPVVATRDSFVGSVNNARKNNELGVILGTGAITIAKNAQAGTNVINEIAPVKRNRFYGS